MFFLLRFFFIFFFICSTKCLATEVRFIPYFSCNSFYTFNSNLSLGCFSYIENNVGIFFNKNFSIEMKFFRKNCLTNTILYQLSLRNFSIFFYKKISFFFISKIFFFTFVPVNVLGEFFTLNWNIDAFFFKIENFTSNLYKCNYNFGFGFNYILSNNFDINVGCVLKDNDNPLLLVGIVYFF